MKSYNNPFTATISGILDLFRKQRPSGVLKPSDRLDGKTLLVDGASSGLGFAVAVDAAKRGAKVVMVCRSGIPEKGEIVKKMSKNPDIHMLFADFSEVSSIISLVKTIKEQFLPLDILVCNAGIVPRKSRKTSQGLEEMFMVNYLSKFIYINLLLKEECFGSDPVSRQKARIIFVSSETHRNPKEFDWQAFGIYKTYSISKSIALYGYYKLLLTTFAVELSRRINEEGSRKYSVFALCPGPVNSNISREAPAIFQPLIKIIFALFFVPPSKAAIPIIYMASSHDMETKLFDYFFRMSERDVDGMASNPENGKKLWELSEKMSLLLLSHD